MAIDSGPARTAKSVTKSDTTTIGGCRGIWVGGAGDLTCDFFDNNVLAADVVIAAVPAGTLLPIAPLRVKAATTATLIVALY